MSNCLHQNTGVDSPNSLFGLPAHRIARLGIRDIPSLSYESVKNDRCVECQSLTELYAVYHAETAPDVVSYRVRPHAPRLWTGSCVLEYSPFLEETLVDGRLIITEVNDGPNQHGEDHSETLSLAREFYRASGIGFRIRNRADVEARPTFEAVEVIQSFRHTSISAADVLRVQAAFADRKFVPLADIRDRFKTPALGFAKVSAMMVRRIVAVDLTQELGPASPIRLLDPY